MCTRNCRVPIPTLSLYPQQKCRILAPHVAFTRRMPHSGDSANLVRMQGTTAAALPPPDRTTTRRLLPYRSQIGAPTSSEQSTSRAGRAATRLLRAHASP
eukprot:GEMP01125533.1.p1 GENE.GEMP01125533.1~~GEMP01125533.1.p1  ORF type:complete len:100 (-),score=13.66 GEMP01125533.1:16-315(-)